MFSRYYSVLDVCDDFLAKQSAELPVQHVQAIDPCRIRQDLPQMLVAGEIQSTWSAVVVMTSLSVRERLKYAEGALRVTCSEPRPSPRLLLHAIVDVAQEFHNLFLFAWLCLQVDEVCFAAWSIVDLSTLAVVTRKRAECSPRPTGSLDVWDPAGPMLHADLGTTPRGFLFLST